MIVFPTVLEKAHAAAAEAVKGLEDNGPCGMAWVVSTFKPFNTWCRRMAKVVDPKLADSRYGWKHHVGGQQFYKPGAFNGHALHVHEAGASAFCQVLKEEFGSEHFYVGSRLD